MTGSPIGFLREVFAEEPESDALVWRGNSTTYAWLLENLDAWHGRLDADSVEPGTVVVVRGDFSPTAVALFLALVERGCTIIPLTESVRSQWDEFEEIAQCEVVIALDGEGGTVHETGRTADHPHFRRLKEEGHPGLVLFSSGSTGKSKAAVHDLLGILEKFHVRRHKLRTLAFLLFDHIGGVNTMLYTLSNGGTLVTVENRDPDHVLAAMEKHQVDLLPTSPTFINLILLSEAYRRHDLSSLKTVTYGTEPMPQSTLERFHRLFPDVKLQQTYGLSEIGILRSKSKSSDSLWVKLGGEGFETRVEEGILQVKARSAMLGYLNAPDPFTEDGWFITGDEVEVDGEYFRILGRKSEIINVGGEKVYPAEVESCLLEMPGVEDIAVYGEPNPITGRVVAARIRLREPEELRPFRKRMRAFCEGKLQNFKIPVKVELTDDTFHSERVKKMRPRYAAGGVGSTSE